MVRLGIGILSAGEDQLQILSGLWIAARLVQRYDAVAQAREPELDHVALLYLYGKRADPGVGSKPPCGALVRDQNVIGTGGARGQQAGSKQAQRQQDCTE